MLNLMMWQCDFNSSLDLKEDPPRNTTVVILSYFQMATHKMTSLILRPLSLSVIFQEHGGKVNGEMTSLKGHCYLLGH